MLFRVGDRVRVSSAQVNSHNGRVGEVTDVDAGDASYPYEVTVSVGGRVRMDWFSAAELSNVK